MAYRTLVSVEELQSLLGRGAPVVLLDCSADLADSGKGERTWRAGHIPGSHHLHLETHLSGPRVPEGPRAPRFTGRHPLPGRDAFASLIGTLGLRPGVQAVCFDGEGSPFAARAWWLLRWLGHEDSAVLDGGIPAWRAGGGPLTREPSPVPGGPSYPAAAPAVPTVNAVDLIGRPGRFTVVDARAPERFRGDAEPLDPVAGHIPGARNRPYLGNLQPDGRFKPAGQLRQEFTSVLGEAPGTVVHQCGSGVTACHNVLAMAHAGLGVAALYPGSWSEWCADPARPVARG